jgi:peptide/nickel transport system ATP-binding protein
MSLLEARGLTKTYRIGSGRQKRRFRAVDDVSFDVEAGETLGIVGESGAGKSTTGRLVLRLIEPDAGEVRFDGQDVRALGQQDLRVARRKMQMVFQDPHSCLDPHVCVGDSVGEPLLVHFRASKDERFERSTLALSKVGLSPQIYDRFPHELSGGQLQRIAIARALTLEPKLIVCDEPVAALDVSIRAQVLNLFSDLQQELGIAYLFISHDLAIVEVFAHRVAVMREGRIVEIGTAEEIFRNPRDEYTRELLAAIPSFTRGRGRKERAVEPVVAPVAEDRQ